MAADSTQRWGQDSGGPSQGWDVSRAARSWDWKPPSDYLFLGEWTQLPRLPDLFRICHVLGLEVYELLPPRLIDEPPPALMRAIAAEIPAGLRFRTALELFLHRAALLQVPEIKVRVRRGTPERMARSLLKRAEVGAPPVDPESLARRMGVRVIGWEGLVDSISGLLVEFAEGPLIVFNLGHPVGRQRFTIAHELCHHLLKHIEQFHVDLAVREEAGSGHDYDRGSEKEANRFAAELLMPEDWVKTHAREITDIESLAKAFAVSDLAMGYRLMGLGLTSVV